MFPTFQIEKNSIDSVIGLTPGSPQAAIWISDGFVYWSLYAWFGLEYLHNKHKVVER